MKKMSDRLFSRLTFGLIFMLLQVFAVTLMLSLFGISYRTYSVICSALAVVFSIVIINNDSNPAYKIAWLVPILALPVFGVLLYVVFGKNRLSKRQAKRLTAIGEYYGAAAMTLGSHLDDIKKLDPQAGLQAEYLEKSAGAAAFSGSETRFLPSSEEYYRTIKEELKKANKFIFLEYFIIEEGVMWDPILSILKEKAAAGVDVRVMYDDLGCIFKLPSDYCDTLEKLGIRACVFHRFIPILSSSHNNRDHRKIAVIDGNVAFTGGVNFADEYINARPRCGHWMDCGIMTRGEAAWGFTTMFLSMWDYVYGTNDDCSKYLPDPEFVKTIESDGWIQPFFDSPIDGEAVGENAYLGMINRAERYVRISTPYLILDNEMITALTNAAKSGVEVTIITPGIPDKKYVFIVTRSYYRALLKAGVRIYEYTPGFIHSKLFVSDDKLAICGTINLDFRSLFLHHECAALMFRSRAVTEINSSYSDILSQCDEITLEKCRAAKWYTKLLSAVLRTFAPLL